MDPSLQYRQYQQQQAAYDPSQAQPYDPSSAAFYSYHQYSQQHYPYYPQDYPNSYQQQQSHHEESSSIHPPGVPIDSQSQYLGQDQYYVYQQQHLDSAQQQWQGSDGGLGPEAARGGARPPPYTGGGRRGGRGGGFGPSFRGRGRGRGRGGPSHRPTPGAPRQQSAPAPQMAWCELCRVDCNSPEILEMHKNGKKHKKNLRMQEELERLNKIIIERQNEKVEESAMAENGQQNVSDTGSRGRGSKRKSRGGRGGNKRMRASERPKRPAEPPKPKPPVVPLVCELCHVTCESQVVFDSHLKGKKHMANLQHLQEQQTLLGHAALEALYPALQALLPALQGICPPNPDASSYASVEPQIRQAGQDPQGILTQLLTSVLANGQVAVTPGATSMSSSGPTVATENQGLHDPKPENLPGGQDPQVILTQLLTSLLANAQVAVTHGAASTSSSRPPVATENQGLHDPQTENSQIQPESGSEDAAAVQAKSQMQPESINSDAGAAVEVENKSGNLSTESENVKADAEPADKPEQGIGNNVDADQA